MKRLRNIIALFAAVCLLFASVPLAAAENYGTGVVEEIVFGEVVSEVPQPSLPGYCAQAAAAYAESGGLYYGYATLSSAQKQLYDLLHEGLHSEDPAGEFSVPYSWRVTEVDLDIVCEIYLADHPECFWFKGGCKYWIRNDMYVVSVMPKVTLHGESVSVSELNQAKARFTQQADAVLSEMELAGVSTDMEIALWLHDKVAELITYDGYGITEGGTGMNHQTAYGGLVDGKAVCAGYARLYQYFLQCAGICAWTVCGVSPSSGKYVNHAWNLMWLGEEAYCLYTDVTWDDQGENLYHLFFARDYSAFSGTGRDSDHIADADYFAPRLPDCSSACASQHVFAKDRIDLGVITAAEVAKRMILQADRRTFVGSFYDPDGKILAWLNSENALNKVARELNLSDGTVYFSRLNGTTAGKELKMKIVSKTEVPFAGVTLSGSIRSSLDEAETVKVELLSGNTLLKSMSCTGNTASYSFKDVEEGTYTLRISKAKHVTHEYTVIVEDSDVSLDCVLRPIGDLSGDGRLNTRDWNAIRDHINKKKPITDSYTLACADIDGNGRVNTRDWNAIRDHINRKNPLW